MSLESGGRADKTGNIYENRFLAKLLLDLIQEQLYSIEVERLGDEGVGVEYIANEVDGGRRYYQCKASNGTNNYWRPSDLNRYNVFQTAKMHITRGVKHTYYFISPVAYDNLDSLCDRARTNYDTADFFESQLTNNKLRNWWEKSKKYFECANDEEAVNLLSQCYFEQIPDGAERIRELENRIRLLFIQESPGTSTAIRVLLENYANDGRPWGKPITAPDIISWLRKEGYHQRALSHDERSLPSIQALNSLYQESFHPVRKSLFHREESGKILECINKGNSVIVQGKAGFGKSGCIQEVVRVLESEGEAHLVLSLDKYRPEQLADKYGQTLGLIDSPVSSLYRLAGGQPCVLIFDQLDALRWINTGTSKSLDICKEMIRQAKRLNDLERGKISLVFVTRTFDYETDPGLRGLFVSDNKSSLYWETIKVGPLSEEEVENLVGDEYASMSSRLRILLQTPSNLYVWERLDTESRNSVKNLRQLMERWWQQTKESCKKRGLSANQIDNCRDRLVSIMQSREELFLPAFLFQDEHQEIDALISQGLLLKEGEKISFVHQSFFDFFSVKKIIDDIYEKEKHLPELFPDRDKQTPDVRYQLLMSLQYLCDADLRTFLTECQQLLESPNIHYYFKCCAFEIIGQIEEPDKSVHEVLCKYYNDEEWHHYIFQTVYLGHSSFIKMLDNLSPGYPWHEQEGRDLLRSVICQDPELVLSILQKQGIDCFTDQDLYEILSSISPDKSETAFLMRLELLKKDRGLLQREYSLYRMIEHGSPQAIPIIQIIIETAPKQRQNIYFPEEKYLKFFSEKNAKEIINSLLTPIMHVAAKEEKLYRNFENKWMSRHHPVAIERKITQLAQLALSYMAKNEPESFFQYMKNNQETSPIKPELMLHAVENLPIDYADQVVTWLLGDFNNIAFEKTSNEETELSCCKCIIERFSPHCISENFALLETFLCQWSLPAETMRTRFKERIRIQHMEGGGNYYAPFCGDFQSVLLPALDSKRISNQTKQMIGVLKRKFPQGAKYFDLPKIGMAHFVHSPIDSHLSRLSDKSWLRLITDMSHNPTKSSSKRWVQGIESSPPMFSQSLAKAARENPTRFAKLSLQFPIEAQEIFADAIVNALDSSHTPIDLVCVILRRFCRNPSRGLAISFARVIESRAEEDWPQDILQQLTIIAKQHEDPRPNELPVHPSEIKESVSCDSLWQGSINCARGYAFHAIGALLWKHSDLSKLFQDVLRSSVDDENLSVQFAAAYCAVPWFNINKEFSEQLFVQFVKRDLRILAVPSIWQILRLCYSNNPDYYRSILIEASKSVVDDLSTCAFEVITVLAAEDNWMMEKLLSTLLNEAQADAVCKQAAEFFGFEWFYECGKKILNHIIDNYPSSISKMSCLFYQKTIQIQRDQDLLLKLLLCKDQYVSQQVFDFLYETKGNILSYSSALSEFIQTTDAGKYYYNSNNLVAFLARLFHQGKDDLLTRRTCLDLWDDIFHYKPMAIKPLSDLIDQIET